MKSIIALTDYKGHFGSKFRAKPYRSGYNQDLLKKYFTEIGFNLEFLYMRSAVETNRDWRGQLVIYTSSEEVGFNYKSFIEDVILNLEKQGAILLPSFEFLRANNNKVYMEMLRTRVLGEKLGGSRSQYYGTFEELLEDINTEKISYPTVIKKAEGAMSKGVFLAKSSKDLVKLARIISRTKHLFPEAKEKLRERKHHGYIKESKYQSKFVIQPFIPNLKNDWKVIIYGDHYYILNRGIKENDFRASGSKYNYKAGSKSEFPIEKLTEVKEIFDKLDLPNLSLDYAYDGKRGYVIEIQAVYFGTSTLDFCEDYYTLEEGKWIPKQKQLDQEAEYVYSFKKYFEKHPEFL